MLAATPFSQATDASIAQAMEGGILTAEQIRAHAQLQKISPFSHTGVPPKSTAQARAEQLVGEAASKALGVAQKSAERPDPNILLLSQVE